MSMIQLVLQLLFAFLGFVLSLKGVFLGLLGVLLFLALPVVSRVTGELHRLANLHLWLATSMLGRMAIVVSEHGDILLKRMRFDDLGVEKISFDNDEKDFEDPANRLHYFMDMPFALADEVHGVLFDPRDAAVGARKEDADDRGESTFRATAEEWDEWRVHEWKRAVEQFPKQYELVDLGKVRNLIDGGERAEYPKRTEEFYKNSRIPLMSGTSATRFIMIIVSLLAPFALMWLLASQGGGGGGTTISYPGGAAILAIPALKGLRDHLRETDWLWVLKMLVVLATLPVMFILMWFLWSPLEAVFAFIVLGAGFWTPAVFTVLLRPIGRLSGGYARLLFQLGFMGYDRPVFEWTPAKYRLCEYSDLHDTGDVTWYGLAGSLVGFTFEPRPESWGAAVIDREELDARTAAVTDGGENEDVVATDIPEKFLRVPSMKRASSYAGFIPRRLKPNHYFIQTGIAWSRFNDSAVGEKSMNRWMYAKEKHGESDGMSDASVMKMMLGGGVFSTLLGVFVFFL